MDAECKDLETLRIGEVRWWPASHGQQWQSQDRHPRGSEGRPHPRSRPRGGGGEGQWGAARVPLPPLPPTCQSKHRNLAHFLPQMEAL